MITAKKKTKFNEPLLWPCDAQGGRAAQVRETMKRAFWDQCKGEMKAGNLDTVPSGSAPQTKGEAKKAAGRVTPLSEPRNASRKNSRTSQSGSAYRLTFDDTL